MGDKARLLGSIQWKVFGVIFGITFCIVAVLVTYFPAQHVLSVRRSLESKAETYGRLVGREVESGIAFNDRETVREIFGATAADGDVTAIALYTEAGQVLHMIGELAAPPELGPRVVEAPRVERLAAAIRCTSPVISKEGPRGTLIIELSTAAIDAERARSQRAALLVGISALGVGFSAAWLVAHSLARRLRAITKVTASVAGGDLSRISIQDESSDEVGQLARSFNYMVGKIRDLMDHISESAAEEKSRLDKLVTQRTLELNSRNEDMRLVLDHVGEGFLTLNRDGTMSKGGIL